MYFFEKILQFPKFPLLLPLLKLTSGNPLPSGIGQLLGHHKSRAIFMP